MATLWLDLETFSDIPIKHGAHKYAEGAEVLLVALAVDDEPVAVWDVQDLVHWRSALQNEIDRADRVVIHNSAFDRTVLRHCGVDLPVEKIDDTMVTALAHSLPGSLGQLCDVLGVPQDKSKDKAGRRYIQLFTKPCPKNWKIRRATRETHPDEWQGFVEYARLDVDAMRHIHGRLPNWNSTHGEQHLWRIDQRINDRGVAIDLELAQSAIRAFQRASRALAARSAALTGGHVSSTTQRQRFIDYLREVRGFEAEDLTKGTVEGLLKDAELDPKVRELLEIRQQAAATSPAKYKVLIEATSSDGRLRGTIQFCGAARTGRDAGRIFQPQNLPRSPDWFDGDVQEVTIEAFKHDCEDIIYDNVSERCAFAVRGSLLAEPGNKLVIADLSNIEGRVLAWLAGEDWKIEAFKLYDRGEGPDLYKVTAGRILGKDPYEVTKGERQTQGKVPELACLGPNTRVITKSGVKPITEVTAKDLLWDGEEWVTNTGLVARGLKQVLTLQGVEMTPDHLVLADGIWQQAQTVATCPNSHDRALATGSESLRLLASTSDPEAVCAASSSSVLAEPARTAWTSITFGGERLRDATLALKRRPESGPRHGSDTPTSAPTTIIAGDCATASQRASTDATTLTIKPTPTTGGAASTSTSLGEQTEPHISRILSRLTDGINLNSNLTELMSTGATSRVISVSSDGEPIVTTCDVFKTCSSASTNLKPVYDIANAGPRNRFTILCDGGAFVVHNCGFGGSVGAFRKMGGSVVDAMDDEQIATIVQGWRSRHPATKRLWYAVESAVRSAVRSPGDMFEITDGPWLRGLLRVDSAKGPDDVDYVRIRLPSGRYLCYRNMHINEDGQLVYEGINQYTRKWELLETYYGKLVENIVQAVARDVFMAGMRKAEEAGYSVVLRVHDELVCEVPDDPSFTHEALAGMMGTNPSWSVGLPLAAAGFEAHRYRKE